MGEGRILVGRKGWWTNGEAREVLGVSPDADVLAHPIVVEGTLQADEVSPVFQGSQEQDDARRFSGLQAVPKCLTKAVLPFAGPFHFDGVGFGEDVNPTIIDGPLYLPPEVFAQYTNVIGLGLGHQAKRKQKPQKECESAERMQGVEWFYHGAVA